MDTKDLLDLLDLNGKPPDSLNSTSLIVTPEGTSPSEPKSLTALDVDAWGLRRGRDLLAESELLRRAGTNEYAAADFFTAAFDPDPRLLPACVEARRHAFLTQLVETPAYHALHAATRLDDTASGIAATHFAEEFAKLQDEDAAASPADEVGREMAALRAVGRALSAAGKDVEEMHEAAAALGMGPGAPGANDPKAIAALFKRVRSDPALRRICNLAGRLRRLAQSKQRQKSTHGLDDVVGVETAGDVGRLLPVELAKLMVPELELDTLRRIVERQALCREHHGVEPLGKGPIIMCVDESGSMSGEKVHTAKALALALAWIARQQRRWCGLIAYSGDSGERLLALPPGRWNETALCDWLSAFIGGGSNLDVPVREMAHYYHRLGVPPGITDLLFVTDAQCRIPEPFKVRFLEWKRTACVRLVTLVIDHPPGDLTAISDEVHIVRSLGPTEDAVGRVLSL